MATLEREKLIGLLVTMLEKRGPGMVAELERRVAAGQPLEVRGICLDVSMQQEALSKFKSANARSRSRTPPREPHPEDDSPPSSLANSASPPEAKVEPKVEPKAASPKKAGTRWNPGGSSAGGARWKPGAPSASLLAAKALMECEAAESFSRSVQVVGDEQVSLLTRPDMHSDLTGTHLSKGQIVEVVARFVCQRDGRVYVRLRMQEGWASTRSKDDWSKAVLGPVAGESPIEPARVKNRITSTAMRLLPEVAPEAVTIPESAEGATEPAAEDGGAEEDEEDGVEEGAVDAEAGDEGEEADEDVGEEEEGEDGEDDTHADEGDEKEAEADEMDAPDDDSEEVEGSASADRSKAKRVRKFRVVVGRCPILSAPNAKELMTVTRANKALLMKEEIHTDGYTFVTAEQRVYLRLTRHRGWIAERSRSDIWRFAVLPITYRKKPLSKKAARRVAFAGGDASEHTKLRSDDLIKNAYGKIVSKKASEAAKKRSANTIGKWTTAVKQAREELNLTGFVAVKKGTPVYARAQELYAESKKK